MFNVFTVGVIVHNANLAGAQLITLKARKISWLGQAAAGVSTWHNLLHGMRGHGGQLSSPVSSPAECLRTKF